MLVYLKKGSFFREVWRRSLTREDLIKKLNVTPAWIENLKKAPFVYVRPELRSRMMSVLGVSFDVIFFQVPYDAKRMLKVKALKMVGLAVGHLVNA